MQGTITTESTIAELVDVWLERISAERRLEGTTVNEYERVLRTLVSPGLGPSRIGQLTTEDVDQLLAELGQRSRNRQRKAKVILGAMLDFAVAQGALSINPVRGSLSISRPPTSPTSLTAGDLAEVHAAVRTWLSKARPGPRSSGDMGDIIEVMIGTGTRIGEVLALRWSDIDLDTRSVSINATIKTSPGEGTYRKPLARPRLVALPEYTRLLLARRRRTIPDNWLDAVFPTRNAAWQQVNNVERRWRQIRREAGLDWITPEMFRRTDPGAPGPFRR